MQMSYQELIDKLEALTIEQRARTVIIFDSQKEEFYPVNTIEFSSDDDIFDLDQPILVFNHVD